MQLQIDGKNIDLTSGLKNHVEEKVEKLKKHSKKIMRIHVVLSVEKHLHIAKATLTVPHHELVAKEETDDLYVSIDRLIEKLDRLLIKHKEH